VRIDNSRYSAFTSNPEMYRLVYEKNYVPVTQSYYFGRGIHLHQLNEARNKATVSMKNLKSVDQKISSKSKQMGEALFAAYAKRWNGDKTFLLLHDAGVPLAEVEFDLPIPGSPHRIVGKMDEIVQYNGDPWVGDIKTANAKASEAKKKIEFGFASQPIFYINAARMLGYPVKGMVYRVVTEHTPPKHWVIESKRTDYQLAQGLISIHQIAETIQMYKKTFGIEKPWPHLWPYPCNYPQYDGSPTCEYAGICNRPSYDLTEEDLEQFTIRIDHLDVMRKQENDNGPSTSTEADAL
jgi:hypothetical protein